MSVQAATSLNTQGTDNIAGAFRELAGRYAELDETDCNDQQKRKLDQLEEMSRQLGKLATSAAKANRTSAARNSRLPSNEANIEFMTALQDYENRLTNVRRELRSMQAHEK